MYKSKIKFSINVLIFVLKFQFIKFDTTVINIGKLLVLKFVLNWDICVLVSFFQAVQYPPHKYHNKDVHVF